MDIIKENARKIWNHKGIQCAIVRCANHINGYVQIPDNLRDHNFTNFAFDNHTGGITYGIDDHGWVGFDTNSVYDSWWIEELGEIDESFPYYIGGGGIVCISRAYFLSSEMQKPWTVKKLIAKVNLLAKDIIKLEKRRDKDHV